MTRGGDMNEAEGTKFEAWNVRGGARAFDLRLSALCFLPPASGFFVPRVSPVCSGWRDHVRGVACRAGANGAG
jgi:hypothetical protein